MQRRAGDAIEISKTKQECLKAHIYFKGNLEKYHLLFQHPFVKIIETLEAKQNEMRSILHFTGTHDIYLLPDLKLENFHTNKDYDHSP